MLARGMQLNSDAYPAGAPFSFDIETTGLDPSTNLVTCICACGDGFEKCWMPTLEGRPDSFFDMMDQAEFLVSFNGVRFDLNFLSTVYRLDPGRVGRWVLKLRDAYEASRLAFDKGFSLNHLLEANGFETKISTGSEAVAMARDGRWDELREYCMSDAALAWISMRTGVFVLPFTKGKVLNLAVWSLGR